jgi:hydrogenase nickel incorporation protein HypA/HybF
MHEVSLMQSALELALEHAARQGASRIHRITLRVGALAGVVPEALEFAFDVVTRDTLADGAVLEVERVPVVCSCVDCAVEFVPDTEFFNCPRCGRPSADVRSGTELELTRLEVS